MVIQDGGEKTDMSYIPVSLVSVCAFNDEHVQLEQTAN